MGARCYQICGDTFEGELSSEVNATTGYLNFEFVLEGIWFEKVGQVRQLRQYLSQNLKVCGQIVTDITTLLGDKIVARQTSIKEEGSKFRIKPVAKD